MTAMEGLETEEDFNRLLAYLPSYGVILCKECQFAIQPSALSSHLQRHQIYRNERRRFLDRLAKLDIRSPDNVPTPPLDVAPFEHLPIYKGFKCNAPGCPYACTSQKRMNQHWSESHGQPDSRQADSRPANLQTFFKGTKIRYFEVSCPPGHVDKSAVQSRSTADTSSPSDGDQDSGVPNVPTLLHHPGSHAMSVDGSTAGLDIDALLYMQHYMLHTARTVTRGTDSPDFWLSCIPLETARHPFLMYGMLSTAAFHRAWMYSDADARRRHQQAALQYQSIGLGGFREAMAQPTHDNSTAIVAFSRLVGVQDCAQSQLEFLHEGRVVRQDSLALDIIESMVLLRGGADLLVEMQCLLPNDSGFILSEPILDGLQHPTRQFPKTSRPTSVKHDGVTEASVFNIPGSIYKKLVSLPDKLVAMDNLCSQEHDVVRESVRLLVASVSQSYEIQDDSTWPIWNGLESWVRSSIVQQGLFQMLEHGRHSALVVLAYWWLLIVRRLEKTYWFVRGMTEKIMFISKELMGSSGAKDLILELI